MKYNSYLIEVSHTPEVTEERYTVVCLRTAKMNLTLNGIRCFLGGCYLLCLNPEDELTVQSGDYEAVTLHFLPFFYNVNLNHDIIKLPVYKEMRTNHGYPDFHLFRIRDDSFFGILPITEEEFRLIHDRIRSAEIHINEHEIDGMWSCRARSDLISILQITENAYLGKQDEPGNEILRYIRDHLGDELSIPLLCDRFHTNRTTLAKQIKALTGLSPMQYILEEKLAQSRPDLLFTEIPLDRIAEKYGFYDSNYFIRMFKKRFGVSPHQYRKEGQAERIRNEHIYKNKAQQIVKAKQFETYIRKGLGRAILFLRNETDKEPYRQAVIDLVSGGGTAGRSFHGQYEADLIQSFPNWEQIAAEISPPLLDSIRQGEKLNSIPMLMKLGFKEDAREAVEELYRMSYAGLVEHTKKDSGEIERYPDCSRRYFRAAAALGRFLKAERERIKAILLDMADLYCYSDTPVIPTYQNPLFSIMDGIGERTLFAIADEVAAEHPNGSKVHPAKAHFFRTVSAVRHDITAHDIIGSSPLCNNYHELWSSFKASSPDVHKEVAEEIVRHVNAPVTDTKRLLHLMSFFDRSVDPDILPPQFPLDPTPILQFAEQKRTEELKRFAKEKGDPLPLPTHPLCMVYSFLSGIRHPAIRSFFEEALEHGKELPFIRKDIAIHAVWGTNFTPDDSSSLERFVRSASDFEQAVVTNAVNGLIRVGQEGITDELIRYLFEVTPFIIRRQLMEALRDTGRLWDESLASLREECLFDEDEKIRELVLARDESSLNG